MRDYGLIVPTIEVDDNVSGIYFLQSMEGYIKIGRSVNIKDRVRTYVTGTIMPIRLVGYIPTEQIERNESFQHNIWHIFKVKGEWYAPCRPLLKYLNWFHRGRGMSLEETDYEIKNYKKLIELETDWSVGMSIDLLSYDEDV